MTNLKMQGSGLVVCYEIEQLRPCKYFSQVKDGLCPSCYAEKEYRLRKGRAAHNHPRTPNRGLIRLGTNIETTRDLWKQFKAGAGPWLCCNTEWRRADFPRRPYFMITRGLEEKKFYEEVLADPKLVNLQVSVDLESTGIFTASTPEELVRPGMDRLAFFNEFDNVLFRFKTSKTTASQFAQIAASLGIRRSRVMETALHGTRYKHYFGEATPLELAGWDTREFGRCNTKCADCRFENGILLCAARPAMLDLLPSIRTEPPPRHLAGQVNPTIPSGAIWRLEAANCMAACGGACTVREAYAWFLEKFPALEHGMGNWRWKVRVALQRAGEQAGPSTWRLKPKYREEKVLSPSAAHRGPRGCA